VDRKPPLLFWTYAAVFKVAGEYNWMALHILSLLGARYNGRAIRDRKTTVRSRNGLIAALFYSVFQPWARFNSLAFNGEMVYEPGDRLGVGNRIETEFIKMATRAVGAGAFLGAGFLLKQPAAIAAVPLGLYLLLPSYRASRSLTRTNSIIQANYTHGRILRSRRPGDDCTWKQGILRGLSTGPLPIIRFRMVFLAEGNHGYVGLPRTCLPLVIGR